MTPVTALLSFSGARLYPVGGTGIVVILGIGIDLVENRRVERELARGEWRQADGIFSEAEIEHCTSTRRPARRYAACFAAKEATLKALGVAVTDLSAFREIDVELGCHRIVLHNRLKTHSEQLGVRHIRLSTSVGKDLSGAMVILEG